MLDHKQGQINAFLLYKPTKVSNYIPSYNGHFNQAWYIHAAMQTLALVNSTWNSTCSSNSKEGQTAVMYIAVSLGVYVSYSHANRASQHLSLAEIRKEGRHNEQETYSWNILQMSL